MLRPPLQLFEQQSDSTEQVEPGPAHAAQSLSLNHEQPAGQQPSSLPHEGEVCTQPVVELQLSTVQASPSSQLIGELEQVPPEQLSSVQASPSSQF